MGYLRMTAPSREIHLRLPKCLMTTSLPCTLLTMGTNPNFEKRTNSELGSVLFNGQSVHHALMKLKRSHSGGPDGIPNVLLKNMARVLSRPLALLFERSMAVVFIPKICKTARIVPLLKKGRPLKASNYCPISLTSTVSKVMERIITDQLISYLSDNNLLSSQQFGFQKNSSTIMQLLDCYNDWSAAQNAGNSVDVIYLDFAKAFDNVVHSKFLLKLAAYGISGNLLAWIKCFLTDRFHCVSFAMCICASAHAYIRMQVHTCLCVGLYIM